MFRSFGGSVATFAQTQALRPVSGLNRSHPLDRRAATPVASRGMGAPVANRTRTHRLRRPRTESIGKSNILGDVRVSIPSATESQSVGFTSSLTSPWLGLSGENRTPFVSVPNGVPHQSATLR